jgi:hypothetical protein
MEYSKCILNNITFRTTITKHTCIIQHFMPNRHFLCTLTLDELKRYFFSLSRLKYLKLSCHITYYQTIPELNMKICIAFIVDPLYQRTRLCDIDRLYSGWLSGDRQLTSSRPLVDRQLTASWPPDDRQLTWATRSRPGWPCWRETPPRPSLSSSPLYKNKQKRESFMWEIAAKNFNINLVW